MTQEEYDMQMQFLLNIVRQVALIDVAALEDRHSQDDSIGAILYPSEWMRRDKEAIERDRSLIRAAMPLHNWIQKQKQFISQPV